jgi:hypothetical protein
LAQQRACNVPGFFPAFAIAIAAREGNNDQLFSTAHARFTRENCKRVSTNSKIFRNILEGRQSILLQSHSIDSRFDQPSVDSPYYFIVK